MLRRAAAGESRRVVQTTGGVDVADPAVAASHGLIVLSALPEAGVLPSGRNATAEMFAESPSPSGASRVLPAAASHGLIVLSAPPFAGVSLSGLFATDCTRLVRPGGWRLFWAAAARTSVGLVLSLFAVVRPRCGFEDWRAAPSGPFARRTRAGIRSPPRLRRAAGRRRLPNSTSAGAPPDERPRGRRRGGRRKRSVNRLDGER